MANKRKISNPLALAVLALLREKAMHPYEMAVTLRSRRQEESIKLRYGSLYTIIELLQREGFIIAQEKTRAGNRPERTVYELTEAGRVEMRSWLRELLSRPAKEYLQFEAGLSMPFALPPAEVAETLTERVEHLDEKILELRTLMNVYLAQDLERVFMLDVEHQIVILEAERQWVAELARLIASGSWDDIRGWKRRHSNPNAPLKGDLESERGTGRGRQEKPD